MDRKGIYDALIIGAGPAGIAAAIWCKRLGLHVLILEQSAEIGGQLHSIHNEIIDYPGIFVSNGLQLKHLFEEHLNQLGITVLSNSTVTKLHRSSSENIIVETDHIQFNTRYVLLATGSKERRLNIPGEHEMLARGEIYSSKKDLDKLKDKRVLIVGGGDRALEGACNIAKVAKSVLLVHRSTNFRARQEFLNKIPHFANVTVKTSTIIEKIHGEKHVEAVTMVNLVDGNRCTAATDAVIIRIGREPAQHFLPSEIKRSADGCIAVDEDGRTNIATIFAIGDLINRPQLSSISYSVGQGMRAASAILHDMKKEEERHSIYGDLS